jgi:hypothetical protein
MLTAFPGVRYWGADGLGLNRAVLVLAPLAIVWMVVALRNAPEPTPTTRTVPAVAPEAVAGDAPSSA